MLKTTNVEEIKMYSSEGERILGIPAGTCAEREAVIVKGISIAKEKPPAEEVGRMPQGKTPLS